jgi:hypothetical protein
MMEGVKEVLTPELSIIGKGITIVKLKVGIDL